MIKPRKRKAESNQAFIIRASKEYYKAGLHIVEIAAKLESYGATTVDVYNAVVPTAKITTNEEREIMLSLRNEGRSVNEISRLTNRSRSCVRRRLERKAEAIVPEECANTLSEVQIDKLRKMYIEEGMGTTAIAKELGVSRGSITYRLKKMNIYEPGRNTKRLITKKDVAKMKRYAKQGLSYNQIAQKTGHTRDTVSLYLRGLRTPQK